MSPTTMFLLCRFIFLFFRRHKEDVITKFFMPNKQGVPNAPRKCPACHRNVFDSEEAVNHGKVCLGLLGNQESSLKALQSEDTAPLTNGAVSPSVSPEDSKPISEAETRPSCPACGKVFKVKKALSVILAKLLHNLTIHIIISDSLCAQKA